MPNAIPEVGMGATGGWGSDCYPFTIIAVSKDGNQALVQADKYFVVEGNLLDGSAKYEYEPDPGAPLVMLRKVKDTWGAEHWVKVSYGTGLDERGVYTIPPDPKWLNNRHKGLITGQYFGIGARRAYRDPHI